MPPPSDASAVSGPRAAGGWPARRADAAPAVSLDDRIRAVEERLIARDERLRARIDAWTGAWRDARRRRRVIAWTAGGVAAAGLLVWSFRRRRHRPAREEVAAGHDDEARRHERAARRHRAHAAGAMGHWGHWIGLAAPLLLPLPFRPAAGRGGSLALAGLAIPIVRSLLKSNPTPPLATVPSLDLARYMGRWYEIARLPEPFESACVGQPQAHYALDGDGVHVENRCRTAGGGDTVARGVARVVPGSDGAKLEVTFAPPFLRTLPFVWAPYWVLHVDADYRVALVGDPARKFLWILAREPRLGDADLMPLVDLAAARGYPVERLQFTR